jgi:adenine deaminase
MAGFDLELVNGRLATSAGIFAVDIGIRDGSIAAIGDWGTLLDAEEVVDLTGRAVLPGGIDTHVHGGDPGAFDFGEVSKAAALGGVTTIFDMDGERTVTVDDQVGVEWTLYEGMQAIYPERVLVRGRSVVVDGAVVGKPGEGEFCVPERAASSDCW